MSLVKLLLLSALSVAGVAGCSSAPPPVPPSPPIVLEDGPGAPIAIASTVDPTTLRPTLQEQRDRLRDLIDLAERRELREGGPHMLRAAKDEARRLDGIEARIDEVMRTGSPDRDVEDLHGELRLSALRLDRLDRTLR